MAESRWEDIYQHLENSGFDVYPPGRKDGECKKPYVVVKRADGAKDISVSSKHVYYDILCYVPLNKYSSLEPFFEKVLEAMKELHPMIRPADTESAPYQDNQVKAHMMSALYENIRKIERR